MFDYIFNHTKQKDLYYIGYSMGGTSLFVLLSIKPEYNTKIKMAICLAPPVFHMEATFTVKEMFNRLPILKVNVKVCDFLLQTVMFKYN